MHEKRVLQCLGDGFFVLHINEFQYRLSARGSLRIGEWESPRRHGAREGSNLQMGEVVASFPKRLFIKLRNTEQ